MTITLESIKKEVQKMGVQVYTDRNGLEVIRAKQGDIVIVRVENDSVFTQAKLETLTPKGLKLLEHWNGNVNNGKNNFFSSTSLNLTAKDEFLIYINNFNA